MRRTLAALLLLVTACADSSSTSNGLTVVSRNLYLGGDIFSIVQVTTATEAAVATWGVWSSVKATNFPARATVIAAEIAAANPDVIGLQEVAKWSTGAPVVCNPDGSGLQYVNNPQASDVQYDFLALLQAALVAKGLHYEVARQTQSFDAELCAVNPAVGPASAIDVRYTDRDVILVRTGLTTQNPAGGLYTAMVEFPIPGTGDPGVIVPDRRAWNVVEVQKNGQWYRVFETHLEVQEIPTTWPVPGYIIQLGQAGELVATQVNRLGALRPLPTIVLGDFNTQAEQPFGSPLRATYNFLAGKTPFPDFGYPPFAPLVGTVSPLADAWPVANPGQPGLTWGFSDDLLTGTPTQRIDLVLTWNAGPWSMTTFGGTDFTSGTPPLHASDHLGIAATIEPR
jgi:endonuclease/exonuclease/phosphatase family metal-dependent hydrolase